MTTETKRGTMTVEELGVRTAVDRESGSLMVFKQFSVQRAGGELHRVEVEVSESGTPQAETCDCPGFKFHRHCSHIDAVYTAGVLTLEID